MACNLRSRVCDAEPLRPVRRPPLPPCPCPTPAPSPLATRRYPSPPSLTPLTRGAATLSLEMVPQPLRPLLHLWLRWHVVAELASVTLSRAA